MRHAPAKRVLVLAVMTALPGCAGVQSVLDPGGPAAARIALFAWVLVGLCGAIFFAVLAAIWVAIRGPHALMALEVVAMPPAEHRLWLRDQAAPAAEPQTEAARLGRSLFQAAGCGACHTVRGTDAAGTIGPDLTHVGSRLSLAGATLPNGKASLVRWIRDNQHIKPENLMPPYRAFADSEVDAVATYLEGLK